MVKTYRTIDFRSGRQPLVQWFKSALFLLELNETRTDFTLATNLIIDWIQRFDEWFKDECGTHELRNLHLLYHREIGVIGSEILMIVQKLQQIGGICRILGFGFSFTVEVSDANQYLAEFNTLLDAGVLSTVGLRVHEGTNPDPTLVTHLAQLTLKQGVKIGLIGPIAYFQSSGLLNLPHLNAGGMTLYPVSDIFSEILPIPNQAPSPCFSRFRLHIDSQGSLYPCFGLFGIKAACLGSIRDAFTDIVLGGRSTSLDLANWAHKGVNLSEVPPSERVSTLPWICERHRLSLLNGT